MKLETNNGLIAISAESELEASFLCLWEAELSRKLEYEGVSPGILEQLLYINSYIETEEKSDT